MRNNLDALERFNITLEWLMALQERDPGALRFGLIHVCFHSKETLGQTYGARDAVEMLVTLEDELRKSFRKTDLVARDSTDFWVLAPYTQPETLTEKVTRLIELASQNGLGIVDRDVAVFAMPGCAIAKDKVFASASDFLAYLKKNRQVSLRWEHDSQLT